MPLSEHVYCVAIIFKMTEWVEQWICIKFCVKLEHSSMETIWMTQKATAMGNWWWAASSWQHTCLCITSCAEFFGKTSNHPGDSAPLQSRFGALWFLAFPQTKIIFEWEGISTIDEIQENNTGQLMVIRRTVWIPKVPTLKGSEASFFPCTMFLASSIFFYKYLYFSYYMAGYLLDRPHRPNWNCWGCVAISIFKWLTSRDYSIQLLP